MRIDEDLTIINRIKQGSIEDFELLVRKYQKPLFVMANNLLQDRWKTQDLVQETFLAAYRKLNTYREHKGQFSTWLFTIARNKCLNELKRKKERLMVKQPELIGNENPAGELHRKEIFQKLDAALNRLSFSDRSIFVLAEFDDLTYEQIARIERINIGTVKSRLWRVKRKLRDLLDNEVKDIL